MKNIKHPYDTPLSSGLRFASELIAWVAGPWVAYTWSGWALLPALLLLMALPGVFSTKDDKNNVVVATPGPVRIVIELLLYGVAAVAPWYVWPDWLAIASGSIVGLSIAFGIPRFLWLAKGAPLQEPAQPDSD